jgi:putative SOS response-associated peptidase YedK
MSLTASDHRAAAIMLSAAIPGFEPGGLASWLERSDYQPHSNIGPGQQHWTVRGRNGRAILDRGLWGFAGPDKPGKLVFNARAESIETRPMFRAAFERQRCLIPADGFFEWQRDQPVGREASPHAGRRPSTGGSHGRETSHRKLPWWFHREDGKLLLFAAVIDPPERPADPPRFSVITVPAAGEVARIHDRMPAILESDQVMQWLFDSSHVARSLLRPHADLLSTFRVSTSFNQVAYDGPIVAEVSH